ncbi:RNA-binding domain-containing protein [Neorhizobium sp. SHOUNA12B]|uniref:RNA-binding domain-containing protein n=1 Tax=Neorhizobium sp. SHOUNA12B TaxID=2908928 RepID=UPI0025ED2BD8|nr:RNA-binding domain-containing protein [Neorhizobium sp. SHOUNA12B]MCJ9671436.1 putative DNA binding domain-containing protein [Neorhizobium sp. SHOUNA12B]
MTIDQSQLDFLVSHPSESLNVEIKNWIDPRTIEGKAKILKAAFALRNRNGGYLVIGLNDTKLTPEPYTLDGAAKEIFHLDNIQELISRHAMEPFEVEIGFGSVGEQTHPVICIPDGIKTPLAAKTSLVGQDGKIYLTSGDIYFRTLLANGTPSSAKLDPRDFAALVEVCFDNREADIGRFLRRQLGARDTAALAEALKPFMRPEKSLKDRAIAVLGMGNGAFQKAITRNPLNPQDAIVLDYLTMKVGMAIDPEKVDALPTQEFLNTVASANPRYTGWPVWLDGRSFDANERPYVVENTWETLIDALDGGWSRHLEFMRFNPNGEFFLRRAMQDDLSEKVAPRSSLDRILMIYRVSEVLAVGISIARSLGWNSDDSAGFAFEWQGLENRSLHDWANPLIAFGAQGRSRSRSISSYAEVPLDTPHSALAPHVAQAVGPLFSAFDGYQPSMELIEGCVERMVTRKM